LYPNALDLLPKVAERNQFTLVVSTSPRAWLATSKMFARYPSIHVALGLHPEVAVAKAGEKDLLIGQVKNARFIGEIGLDGSSRFKASLPLQRSILDAVLAECAHAGGKVMSLHSRGAADFVLDALAAQPDAGVPVLHWFSGTKEQLQRAVHHGAWFSVGPAMMAAKKGRALAAEMPPGRVLPETDGPFACKADGTPWFPWEAIDVAQHLAFVWGISLEDTRDQLAQNLEAVISLCD
jgi:TatD DNase family protein